MGLGLLCCGGVGVISAPNNLPHISPLSWSGIPLSRAGSQDKETAKFKAISILNLSVIGTAA